MDAATAEYPFSEIRLPKLITALLPELIGNVEHRREPKSGTALQVTGVLRFSDIHLGTLAGPTPIPAEWLPVVERRIQDSLVPYGTEINDGRWLSLDIGRRAMRLFEAASDVLPGEPYIYSSVDGDLVAEFKDSYGRLTTIIGPTFTIGFAVVGREILKEVVQLRASDDMGPEREMLQRLTMKLRTRPNGAVESQK